MENESSSQKKTLRQKELVRKQFGVSAEDYATSDVHAQGESLQEMVRLVDPKATWSALDLATGAGHTAIVFAPHVQSMLATDLTEEMLAATRRLARVNRLENLQTEVADAEDLSFEDETFDLVTCRLAFHHFPSPHCALSEISRVLKPGGHFAISDNYAVEDVESARIYNEFERLRDPSHVNVYSVKQLAEMHRQAGLQCRSKSRMHKDFEFHKWADRQRVSDSDKQKLREMVKSFPKGLAESMCVKMEEATFYFRLHEIVMVSQKQ